MTCIVENSNPAANVSWVVDGHARVQERTTRERVVSGGWRSISRLSVEVPSLDRDMMVNCHGTNHALGKSKVDSYQLSVLSKYMVLLYPFFENI